MRIAALLVASGCTFTNGSAPEVAPDADVTPGPADSGTTAAQCHVPDPLRPDVRLCLDFEEPSLSPTLTDAANAAHLITAIGLVPMPRTPMNQAANANGAVVQIQEHPDLDITPAVTVEMWLKPKLPSRVLGYPLANQGQYLMTVDSSGVVGCLLTGDSEIGVHANTSIKKDMWAHVACVFDGSTMKVFIDGKLSDCQKLDATLPTDGIAGTQLAFDYQGGLDDVHVFSRALTDAEVCSQAGKSGPMCTSSTSCSGG